MHFYIIFGTNLLTEGPVQIAVFWPILVFRRKGISNKIQTEQNLREDLFWNKRNPGDLEWRSRKQRGGHEVGRCAQGGRHAPTLMGPSCLNRPTSSSYIYPRILKHPGAPRKTISTAATFYIREIPSWSLCRCSAGGGIYHGGPLHHLQGLSDEL